MDPELEPEPEPELEPKLFKKQELEPEQQYISTAPQH
jgi:hypothetical protein